MLKKVLAFLIITAMLFSSTSCSNEPSRKNLVLSLYMMDGDSAALQAISKFNSSEKWGKIEAQTFFYDKIQELGPQFQKELASGAGPDIFVVQADTLPNLSQYIKANYFVDLNTLIKEDRSFNIDDYNKKVLDYGVYGNSRYVIPLNFSLDTLVTTKEILTNNNIKIDPNTFTIEDFAATSTEQIAKNKSLTTNSFYFSLGLMSSLVDMAGARADIDSQKGINLLKSYKTIYSNLASENKMFGRTDYSPLLKNEEVLMLNYPLAGLNDLSKLFGTFRSEVDPTLLPLPTGQTESSTPARPITLVAINKNCKDKKAAFEFIKLLLSKEIQTKLSYGLPVNKVAYEQEKQEVINIIKTQGRGGITKESTLKSMFDQLDSLVYDKLAIDKIDIALFVPMYEQLTLMTKGNSTPEATAKKLQEMATQYINTKIEPETVKATPATSSAAVQQSDNLTIQYMESSCDIKNAIREFNTTRKDIQIKGTMFPNSSFDEFIAKLTTSIMAGEGPDILVYNPNQFNSFTKTLATGVFADLETFINNDSTYKKLNLNQQALSLSVIDGKRQFMPLRYDVPLLISTKGVLDRKGVKVDLSGWTLDTMHDTVMDFIAKREPGAYFFNSSFDFEKMIKYSGISFIDYKNKESSFDSPEFIKLMKMYKDIQPAIMPKEIEEKSGYAPLLLKNNSLTMGLETGLGSPEMMQIVGTIYSYVNEDDIQLYTLPTIEKNDRVPFTLTEVASINQSCKNKEAAFDFIEILLSEDIQKAYDKNGISNIAIGFPVNTDALKSDLDTYQLPEKAGNEISVSSSPDGSNPITFKSVPIPQTVRERIEGLNTYGALDLDKEVYKIINEGMKSYLDGNRTVEQAAKDINDKVSLFLNE